MTAFPLRFCFVLLLSISLLAVSVHAIYEDQLGTVDWSSQQIGNVEHSVTVNKDLVVVSTTQGVIAGLSRKDGAIVWRRVFEPSDAVRAMHLKDKVVITLQGDSTIARAWRSSDGALLWEEVVSASPSAGAQLSWMQSEALLLTDSTVQVRSSAFGKQLWLWTAPPSTVFLRAVPDATGTAVYVLAAKSNAKSAVSIVAYTLDARTGKLSSEQTVSESTLAIQDIRKSVVTLNGQYAVIVSNPSVVLYNFKTNKSKQVPLSTLFAQSSQPAAIDISHPSVFVLAAGGEQSVVAVDPTSESIRLVRGFKGIRVFSPLLVGGDVSRTVVVTAMTSEMWIEVESVDIESGVIKSVGRNPKISSVANGCVTSLSVSSTSEAAVGAYSVWITAEDHSFHQLKGETLQWSREEALGSAVQAELMDLPLPQQLNPGELGPEHIEELLAQDPLTQFKTRITGQFAQLNALIQNLLGAAAKNSTAATSADLNSGDRFGYRKIIVVLTSAGKLFGIHSESGRVVWSRFFSRDSLMTKGQVHVHSFAFVRTHITAHASAELNVFVSLTGSTKSTLVITVDPLTGEAVGAEELQFEIKHIITLPFHDSHHRNLFGIVDQSMKIHIRPKSNEAQVIADREGANVTFHIVDKKGKTVQGFALGQRQKEFTYESIPVWTVTFADNEEVVSVAHQFDNGGVFQPARIKGDARLLYKYLNPNLMTVATVADKNAPVLHLYIIDTVTGSVIHHSNQPGCKEPVSLLHYENWVLIHYWNEQAQRHEMTSVELYEDRADEDMADLVQAAFGLPSNVSSPEKLVFSSRIAARPFAIQQSYIFPAGVRAMGVTQTAQGITTSMILLGLTSGQVAALDRRFFDARRPMGEASQADKDEGLFPYQAVVPIPPHTIVNYYKSLPQVRGIQSAPAHLESTSLVFAYGLDLFFTRLAPSKTYDILSEDFSYAFLALTVVILLVAVPVSYWFTARNELKSRWK